MVQPPAGTPDFGEDDFEAPPTWDDAVRAPPDEGVGTPRSGEDDFEVAPDEGRNTVVVLLPGGALSFASRYSSLGRAAARLDGLASRRP